MHDVIIVGARCAGSPLAMLLARKGYRVLLVDRASFPSDMTMSTHLVWHAGASYLKRWGLLDQVAGSNCPPISQMCIDFGPIVLTGTPPPADDANLAYGPRRIVLDKILVDAAVNAGVELRERFTVDDILTDGDRVSGIRGTSKGGGTVEEKARIVIGADGMNSTVARAVQAREYNTKPRLQGTYFTYWSGVPIDGVELYIREWRGVYSFPTNAGLTLIGVNWAANDFGDVSADIEGHYRKVVEECAPPLAERFVQGKREERWLGGSIPNFFREAAGSGWALVGDAGVTVDPCTAEGITNAFRDAEYLAEAIDEGLSGRQAFDEALVEYGRRRDESVTPIYEFTCQLATFEPPPPDMLQLFGALSASQADTDRFIGVLAQSVPVQEFFAPDNIERIVAAASA